MISGQSGGAELLEQSLTLALEHGYQDHVSRAYTNFSECCMIFRDFASAERLLAKGIAFCVQHDLDSTTHYLLGRQAQLRMEQGRFREAEAIANGVMAKGGLPLVMHLPALTVLGRVGVRLGAKDATGLLHRALTEGLATKEPQRILPVRFGLLEAAWLSGDIGEAHRQIEELAAMDVGNFRSWDLGEMLVWRQRFSIATPMSAPHIELPAPRAAELDGSHSLAADLWLALDQPYEAALALLQSKEGATGAALVRAVEILDGLEARPVAALARRLAREIGAANLLPKQRRGPYSAAKRHPLGLTPSEQRVLTLISEGLSNKEIARQQSRSLRTVEHQVSAVLGKLNTTKRMDALLRVRSEPWLLGTGDTSAEI
jgi:DNA-binding CsgD family transcriptional regulator